MKTRTISALSGSLSVILIIVAIVMGLNYLHNIYMKVFEIDYLWDNGFCQAIDDEGKTLIDKETGNILGTDGVYSIEYCAFNPLLLTTPEFKEAALTTYGGPGKVLQSMIKFMDGTWKLPDQELLQKDLPLSTMIINPWYTSDDVYFTPNTIYYSPDLSVFQVDNTRLVGFNAAGLNLSWANMRLNYNNDEQRECTYMENQRCEKNPATCSCRYQVVQQYYLYMDTDLIITLPMQLYLGKEGEAAKSIEIKVGGKRTKKEITPISIKTLQQLDSLLLDRFYDFKNSIKKECDNLTRGQQKSLDSKCKFFTSESLSGLIIALRRILVIHLPETVIDQYIERVNKKVGRRQIDYLEFFLWLACKSYRNKITYTFKPFKKK